MVARAHFIRPIGLALVVAALVISSVSPTLGDYISEADIVPTPGHVIHTRNGQLDLILFNFSNGAGVNNNELKVQGTTLFNGDNANTDMPVGIGNGAYPSASESYITSIGDLRNFYRTMFPDGEGGATIHEIVLCVDLNKTGKGQGNNDNDFITLMTLDIVVDYDPFLAGDPRNDPWSNDLDSAAQNATEDGFSGGMTAASLDPAMTPKTLTVNANGSGWADYMIYTGINPFDQAYSDETPILFFWESADHHGRGTDIFISGAAAPEPATMLLLGLGGTAGLWKRRRTA